MKSNKPYSILAAVLSLLFGLCLGNIALADDTDIYVNTKSITASEPIIMFTLDYNSNLGSNVCNFAKSLADSSPPDYAGIAAACNSTSNSSSTTGGWTSDFVANYLSQADITQQSSNNSSQYSISLFTMMRGALRAAMAGLDSVKVGLIVNHDDNCNPAGAGPSETGCSNGAYILMGAKSIDPSDINYKANINEFFNKLSWIPEPKGNFSHKYQGKEMYFELFRYLTGQGVYNGHVGYKDFGNTDATDNLNGTDATGAANLESPDYSAIAWDTTVESSGNYISPLLNATDCTKIYAVNFAFGNNNSDSESDTDLTKDFSAGGMIQSSAFTSNSPTYDNLIAQLHKLDLADGSLGTAPAIAGTQNVTSYFVVKNVNTTTNGWAASGGTGNAIELGTDPTSLVNKLKNIFSQILSVSTTFVSASVPVNVFNRADYLDDVYMALFEAQKGGLPRWIGNLKKLKLMQDSNLNWYIGDVNKNPAFGADGRINYNALTYWTDSAGFDVVATYTKDEISGFDGRSINRGGAGQQIPGFLNDTPTLANPTTPNSTDRTMYLEPTGYTNGDSTNVNNALVAFNADTTNAAANAKNWWNDLNTNGIASSGTTLNNSAWAYDSSGNLITDYTLASTAQKNEAINILKWARGMDVMNEDADNSSTDSRPWLMDDPIHSRPLAINYGGSATNPDVRIIITGNDGFVHMFQNTDSSGNESGLENWAFIPRYALRILERLKNDNAGSPLHPYGVDGAPVAYTYDANQDGNIDFTTPGDKAYVYFGMRRGGRYYYGLDVTNPDSPKMLWSISNNSPGFSELGLTFSTPKLAYLTYKDSSGTTNTLHPVLIFGGGYDTNKDYRSNSVGSDDTGVGHMGTAIYIVDALNGSLIWKGDYGSTSGYYNNPPYVEYRSSDMTDSIPSEVTALDSDGDGSVDRLYVGDTGGHIFRVDLAGSDRTQWTVRTLANLGRHINGASKYDDRRFFHAIDVVQTRYAGKDFDAVLVGSGDRANPLDLNIGTKITQNYFYMIKDFDTVSGTTGKNPAYPYLQGSLADLSNNCMQTGTCQSSTVTALNNDGWKIQLTQTIGEKVLSRPITINGIVFFTTYLPPSAAAIASSCDPLEGNGSIYGVNLQDATAVYNWDKTNTTTDSAGNVVELGTTDRYMHSGDGIPADVIVVRKGGENQAILPGQNYTQNVSSNSGYKTFWYTDGE